jgi:hypothetical protein
MSSIMLQPQSCRFLLYGPFREIISNHIDSLPFEPANGVQLFFQSRYKEYGQSVSIEINSEGDVSKVIVIDKITNVINMIFDFGTDQFIHYGEILDLVCGQPLFHMLQQTFATKYQEGHYSVAVTTL